MSISRGGEPPVRISTPVSPTGNEGAESRVWSLESRTCPGANSPPSRGFVSRGGETRPRRPRRAEFFERI